MNQEKLIQGEPAKGNRFKRKKWAYWFLGHGGVAAFKNIRNKKL